MADIIKSRRDTAENWRTANPTLAEGELGFETDTKRYKLGDGKKAWNDLEYRDFDVVGEIGEDGSDSLPTTAAVLAKLRELGYYEDNPEYVRVITDSEGRLLFGIKTDGSIDWAVGVPAPVKEYIDKQVSGIIGTGDTTDEIDTLSDVFKFLDDFKNSDTLKALLEEKVDKEDGQSLIDAEFAGGTTYEDHPEFVKVVTDSEGRVLAGIRTDGAPYFPQNEMYHIVSNPEWLAVWLDSSDKIIFGFRRDGKTVIGDADFLDYIKEIRTLLEGIDFFESTDNPEWINLELDADGKILSGTRTDGSHYIHQVESETIPTAFSEINDTEGRTEITTDADGKIISYRKDDGTLVEKIAIEVPKLKTESIELGSNAKSKLLQDLVDAGLSIESSVAVNQEIEIASGKMMSYGSYQSELDAMPIADNKKDHYIKSETVSKNCEQRNLGEKIVIMNHDDLNPSDYIVSRKIHNKYGSKASFCAVFIPFESVESAREKISNVKKLINDGHEIGLHAIMGFSYWEQQMTFDVKPNGSNTFAPNRNELLGSDGGGIGTNTFDTTITPDTTVANIYGGLNRPFYGSRFTSIKAVNMTDDIVNEATRQYVIYSDEETIEGIDDTLIDDMMTAESANTVRLTALQWLEKYYNHFIDSSLGYSKYDGTIEDRFAEDYSIPKGADAMDYYPDADHLINGKMIYWDDTTHPHYSEAKVKTELGYNADSYQKVGKFTKGLYKDSFSTCNYEVFDRCIEIATAYFRHYYGLKSFTDAHTHGVKYLQWFWFDENGVAFLDRNKKIIFANGRFYVSRIGAFLGRQDMAKGFGFYPVSVLIRRLMQRHEGVSGFYYGQNNIKNPEMNTVGNWVNTEFVNYLNLFGKKAQGAGNEDMSYGDFMEFTKGIDNLTKYFYENHDKDNISRNGKVYNIYNYLYDAMNKFVASIGTGKIPIISVDTLALDAAAQHMAIDILLRFITHLGYSVVPYHYGCEYINSINRNTNGNLFPNYSFKQSILEYFGGSCEDKHGYIPDGWLKDDGELSFSVENGEFSIIGSGRIRTRMFGLPAGTYKLKYSINTDGETSTSDNLKNRIDVKLVRNGDKLRAGSVIKTTHAVNSTDTQEDITIIIPEPYRKYNANDPVSVMLDGYQDNVMAIELDVRITSGISIKNVSLYKI